MSAGAEGSKTPDAEQGTATIPPPQVTAKTSAPGHPHPDHHHHVLIEPDEDRWQWRRRIRQNPGQLAVYRVGVAIAGLLLICLGFISGPIPGPGGIPLVLLGLAIWSSEFEWAYKLMQWFKGLLHRYQAWPRRAQVLFWVAFFAVCGALGYCYMLLIGVPGWLPGSVDDVLLKLPGLQR
jgi:uncharacterized protein (TIGR02611 family)